MEFASHFIQSATASQLDELNEMIKTRRVALNPFRILPVDCFLVISSLLEIDSLALFESTCKYNKSLTSLDQSWSSAAKTRGIKKLFGVSWRASVKKFEEKRRSWVNLEQNGSPPQTILPSSHYSQLNCCDVFGDTLVCANNDRMVRKFGWVKSEWEFILEVEIESVMLKRGLCMLIISRGM
jgi:hypothetical protein